MNVEKEMALYLDKAQYSTLAENSKKNYTQNISTFLKHFEDVADPSLITLENFETYLTNWKSMNTKHAKINSVKFFYNVTGIKGFNLADLEKPKRVKFTPDKIPRAFLMEAIGEIDNLKHKALLTMSFSTGMWLHEILDLKLSDVIFETGKIQVHNKNPERNRIIVMSDGLLKILQHYIREHSPNFYLFNGQHKLKYNKKSALCVVKKCLGEKYTFHSIRNTHIYFLIETGIDKNTILEHLGLSKYGKKRLNLFSKNSTKTKQPKIKAPM